MYSIVASMFVSLYHRFSRIINFKLCFLSFKTEVWHIAVYRGNNFIFLLPLREPSSFISTPLLDGFYHLTNTTSSHSFDTLVYTGMVLQAAALPKGAKVEIEAVAIVGNISDA